MVEAIIFKAPAKINPGIFEFFLHKSMISYRNDLKGLSITATLISSFMLRYLKAVTAPIDLPHNPTQVTFFLF